MIGLRPALALAIEAAIWTLDNDFFGCGVATQDNRYSVNSFKN